MDIKSGGFQVSSLGIPETLVFGTKFFYNKSQGNGKNADFGPCVAISHKQWEKRLSLLLLDSNRGCRLVTILITLSDLERPQFTFNSLFTLHILIMYIACSGACCLNVNEYRRRKVARYL